jgi:phenylacetate-CoA ligase
MKTNRPDAVPVDRRERNPLITSEAYAFLRRVLEHPAAPAWNYVVGDRVRREDLARVEATRRALKGPRERGSGAPSARLLAWVRRNRDRVPSFRQRLPPGFPLARRWGEIPTTSREELVLGLPDCVPDDADLSRLIVYDTSGTTGHAIRVPHHPRAMAQNHAYLEYVLARHGVALRPAPGKLLCVNVGAQASTVVFATTFSVWKGAGFAKVNLHPRMWTPAAARRFFAELAPELITGDPIGFAEMVKWRIEARPRALVSTAVTLEPRFRDRLARRYGCPVIDTYATTETGPIAYANREGGGLSVLPEDIYVEIVDPAGRPAPEGELGEICVSGGRNPYLPLLRYRTGDFGRLVWSERVRSDPTPRILDLAARDPVCFRAADGSAVSPVDVGRVIRRWVFVQHEFVQRRDGSCEIVVRPAPGARVDTRAMAAALGGLFGEGVRVTARVNPRLGDGGVKVVPFRREGAGQRARA